GRTGAVGIAQAAGDDHRRRRELLHPPPREVVVGGTPVLLAGVAGMEGESGHLGLLDEPLRELDTGAVARLAPGAQLHRDRQPAALVGGTGERDRAVWVAEQR